MWNIKIESQLKRNSTDIKWWSIETDDEPTVVSTEYQDFREYFNTTYIASGKIKQITEMDSTKTFLNRIVYIKDIYTRLEIETDERVLLNLELRQKYETANNIKEIFFRVTDIEKESVLFERISNDSQ